jgi:hypothetical protein
MKHWVLVDGSGRLRRYATMEAAIRRAQEIAPCEYPRVVAVTYAPIEYDAPLPRCVFERRIPAAGRP